MISNIPNKKQHKNWNYPQKQFFKSRTTEYNSNTQTNCIK